MDRRLIVTPDVKNHTPISEETLRNELKVERMKSLLNILSMFGRLQFICMACA